MILTGIGTVLADDPLMTDRSNLQRRRRLMRVVLDTQCRLPLSSRLVESANDDLIVFCARTAPNDRQRALRQRGVVVETMPLLTPAERGTGDARAELDLRAVLKRLGELEMLSVLLESGPGLNAAFLSAGLVDKVVLFFSETELGPEAIPFANNGQSPFALIEQMTNLDRCDFLSEGLAGRARQLDACVRGTLHDPWLETFALTSLAV